MPITATVTVTVYGTTVNVNSTFVSTTNTTATLGVAVTGQSDLIKQERVSMRANAQYNYTSSRTFNPGSYEYFAFAQVNGAWQILGSRRLFTVNATPATPPTPETPTAPVTSTMPVGDLPGWKQVWAQDFSINAAKGAFRSAYPDVADYGDGTIRDTSKKGVYNTALTVSAHDSCADIHFRTINGTPTSATLVANKWGALRYGRTSMRYRADSVAGWKVATMLWPSNDVWAEGEVDYPEGDFSGRQQGFVHRTITGREGENAYWFNAANDWEWHIATIEWSPGLLVFYQDGVEIGRTTASDGVPTTNHRWMVQVETSLGGPAPAATAEGHFLIDWMTYYSKV